MKTRQGPKQKRRAAIYLLIVIALFAIMLVASRLADLGIVAGEGFGAGDWKRGTVTLEFAVVPKGGGPKRDLGRAPILVPGDELELSYKKTRWLYLWVLKVNADRTVTPIVPSVMTATNAYGRRVNPAGETVPKRYRLDSQDGRVVIMGIFVPLPYRIEQIRAEAQKVESNDPETIARNMRLSGRRFVHAFTVSKARDAP